jgi:hypothetical protein
MFFNDAVKKFATDKLKMKSVPKNLLLFVENDEKQTDLLREFLQNQFESFGKDLGKENFNEKTKKKFIASRDYFNGAIREINGTVMIRVCVSVCVCF